MGIVNHLGDPVLEDIRGIEDLELASKREIRELHIGLWNNMPDSAYFETFRTWARYLNWADPSIQVYLHPVNIPGMERSKPEVLEHLSRFSRDIDSVLKDGLDAMVFTGGDLEVPNLEALPFVPAFKDLVQEIEKGDITTGLFACLAFHILLKTQHGIDRTLHDVKNIGVHDHLVPLESRDHFLVRDADTHHTAVHARWGDVERKDLEGHPDWIVLNHAINWTRESVGAAVDPQMKFLGLQTHSEYSAMDLLMEYLRDLGRHIENGDSKPPFPTYLTAEGKTLLTLFQSDPANVLDKEKRKELYAKISPHLMVTWKGAGNELIQRWLAGLLKITGKGRHEKYMKGVDPENPLLSLAA